MRPWRVRLWCFTIGSKENSYAVEGKTQTLGPDRVHLSLASGNLHRGFGDPSSPRLRVNLGAEIERNYEHILGFLRIALGPRGRTEKI
jgi:hypothetical protein